MDLPTRHSRINFCKPRHADASFQNISLSLYLSPTYTHPIHVIDTPSATPDTSSTPPPSSLSLTMRLPFFAALLGVLNTSLAHNIQLGAHQRECFHEVLHKDDKMTVTFQVGDREFGGAGNLEIDFWVGAPLLRALGEAETALSKGKDIRRHFKALWTLTHHTATVLCNVVSCALVLTRPRVLSRSSAQRTNT